MKRLTLGKRALVPRMGGSALDPSHFDDFENNTQPWIQGVRENKGVVPASTKIDMDLACQNAGGNR